MGLVEEKKKNPANIFKLARLRKKCILKHNLPFTTVKQVPLAGKV